MFGHQRLVSLSLICCLGHSPLVAQTAATKGDHPLTPVIKIAKARLAYIDQQVRDYKCLLLKREQIDGQLSPYNFMQLKLRHEQTSPDGTKQPFAVYLKFLKPSNVKDREVLFVDGERNGDMLVRRGGSSLLANITVRLDPKGRRAMEESRYPVTQVGIRNLIERLIEVMEVEQKFDECEVKTFEDAELDGRPCQHIQVVHPTEREHFQYHLARVFIDKELQLPVYFATYDWPKEKDQAPELLEEYIYTKINLNVGLSDEDFKSTNPNYHFQPEKSAAEALAEEKAAAASEK
jgi:hypothetical protein